MLGQHQRRLVRASRSEGYLPVPYPQNKIEREEVPPPQRDFNIHT